LEGEKELNYESELFGLSGGLPNRPIRFSGRAAGIMAAL